MSEQPSKTDRHRNPSRGNVLLGLILLVVGFTILLDKLDFVFLPHWIFSWPMIIIVIGLVIGAKQRFTGPGWLILVLIGTFFLLRNFTPYHWHLYQYAWPVGIIVVGLFILFRAVARPSDRDYDHYHRRHTGYGHPGRDSAGDSSSQQEKKSTMSSSGEDFLNITNLFGGTKKRIFSKDFRGGDIVNFFGGTELDFTQADIREDQVAMLDVTQMFGGVKLIVPSNWTIKSDMTAILGGYDDKRTVVTDPHEGPKKVLVIDGTCIFGGVEIKSY